MTTRVLVAYATHHGATREIAERIASTLAGAGLEATARNVAEAGDPGAYDAVVVGSAVYIGKWLKEASGFVRNHAARLAGRPVWLFSSGPTGTATVDAEGRDLRAETSEVTELRGLVGARDHRVFYGAYDPASKPIGLMERLVRMAPASRDLLPAGDFRDWPEIEAWARGIAADLAPVAAGQEG